MKSHTRHIIVTSAVLGALALGVGVFAWSGIYNIGADDTHTKPVYSMLKMMRERSVTARARKLHPPPNLNDAARIRQGAGNYNAMCTGCHLAPGMGATELSQGLYPVPPNLSRVDVGDSSHHFWVIKHGIKASGMPAWGKSMSDEYIWNMVALLQQLPNLDEAQYLAMVAASGGHSHGGGETAPHGQGADDHGDMPMGGSKPHIDPPVTPAHSDGAADPHAGMDMASPTPADASKPHAHPPGTPANHHDVPAPAKSTPAPIEHRHADGTVESHPAPQPARADDGHDHEH
ncbi:MAG: c-type cytochrome [Lysobacter sp.]|nr:c-type cytochrome [Lysobacter sp.]